MLCVQGDVSWTKVEEQRTLSGTYDGNSFNAGVCGRFCKFFPLIPWHHLCQSSTFLHEGNNFLLCIQFVLKIMLL